MIMWPAKWMYDLMTDCNRFEIDWNLDQNWSWNWKISLQLSGISHSCHHQDLDIDWTLAQHWSKSWKISLQLSRIAHICHHQDLDIDWTLAQHWSKSWKISPNCWESHICHHQDLDIDWNLAQHWSKSWKISPTVGNLTSVTTIMRSKSQNGVEKCYSKATWERPIWDAPKAIFAAKMQSAKSLSNYQYSTEHCMNSCCQITAQRI
jgi:hypothetical protein